MGRTATLAVVIAVLRTSLALGGDPARSEFESGIRDRNDAGKARVQFANAAATADKSWNQYRQRTVAVAANRGRAHFLAGDLPQSIRAFREGLALYPWDAELQRGLALARAAVAYPTETELAARVRPDPPAEVRNRVSPFDLLLVSAVASLVLAIGLARRLTRRDRWAWPVAACGLLGVLVAVGIWWQCDREECRDRANPTVVIAADTVLRTGNGPSYPPRVEAALPRGAEVRERSRRGGWVQVELAGGAVGWVPETVVLKSADE